MIILKLGGSVITRKEKAKPTANHDNLKRIAQEIAESKPHKLIIVHGAGSFGHPHAKKYQIGDEIQDKQDLKRKIQGFSLTHHSVDQLNSLVCESLRTQGIPTIPLPPSAFITTTNKRIKNADMDLIQKYLQLNFVPVLYGDVVLDEDPKIKMAVLSGDQIIKYLAEELQPERVILATDVDGIYNKNPKKHPDAQLLKTVSSMSQIDTEKADIVDVTGGMRGKLSELLSLLDLGIESEIINANQINNVKYALNGEKVTGTIIKKLEGTK